jgi:hypothetical protein
VKYRITLGQNRYDGGPIYRIYRIEGEICVYLEAAGTEEKAREFVYRLMNPEPEVTITELES